MDTPEFDDITAYLLSSEESLDDEESGADPDEGYSPADSPRELRAWGLTTREARTHESLSRRLAGEVPNVSAIGDGDGIGDIADGDGEPVDRQVGNRRSGRLVAYALDADDSGSDYRAHDVGVDGGTASAEEAAMHVIESSAEYDDDTDEWT